MNLVVTFFSFVLLVSVVHSKVTLNRDRRQTVVENPEEHHGHAHHHHPDAHFPGNPNHHHHGTDQTDHSGHDGHVHAPGATTVVTKSEHVDTSHRSSSTTHTAPNRVIHTVQAPVSQSVAYYRSSSPVVYYRYPSGHFGYSYGVDPSADPLFRETVRG